MRSFILIVLASLILGGCSLKYPKEPTYTKKPTYTKSHRNLEERNYDELPSNVQNWLKKEGLDDLWYNGN